MVIILVICLVISIKPGYVLVNAACTWPSDFVDSTWTDSLKGDMDFTSTTMTGWTVSLFVVSLQQYIHINNWECVTYDSSGPYLVMKSTSTFEQYGDQFTDYRCLMLEKITDVSFRYYQMDPIQTSFLHDRLNVKKDSSISDTNELCTVKPATGSEFQMMLRKGYEDEAAVTCPYSLLADYEFTYQQSDGRVSCDSSVSDAGYIEMCSNVTQFRVPSLTCSPYPLYSSEDTVWCVDVVVVGTDTFVSLYNGLEEASSIDETNTYRFTCVGINVQGTSMSVTPQHCKANQTSTQVPVNNAGSAIGAVLSLSINGDTCRKYPILLKWAAKSLKTMAFTSPCPWLNSPAQGTVVKSTNGAVTRATYSCEGNYTLSGNDTRVCQADGTWSGSEPSCTCPITTSVPHGSVTSSVDGLSLTFTCDAGYVLVGESTLTCNTGTNTWSDTNPTCDECQPLSAPINGSFTISSTGLTSVVTYSCNSGTTLNGDTTRTCNTDTSWTNSAPTCTTCPTLTDIASGNVTLTSDSSTTLAIYYCAAGYTLTGENTSVCTTTGIWDSTPPACVCNTPSPPGNGTVRISDDLSEAVYTCGLGFTILGPSTRNCRSDGSGWSNMDPDCVGCAALERPLNGSVSLSTNGTLTKATFTCDVGFSLKGDVNSQCQTDGTWSKAGPSCSQCNDVPSVSSGSFTLTSDGTITSAEYSCKVGTTISGDVIVSCDVNGDWSITSTNTSCVKCSELSEAGGSYSLSSNGTTTSATLTCSSGYVLVGSGTVECQSNGSWTSSSTQPECVSTSEATEGSGSGNKLLPAVIVLAILTTGLVAALGGSLFYIWKLKKTQPGEINKPDQNGSSSYLFPASKPPVGHMQHLMDVRNTSSAMSAPLNHHASPRLDSDTPRSLKTSLSTRSVHLSHLSLFRGDTSSSIILDHDKPAPWNRKPTSESDTTRESFPPITENTCLTSTPRNNDQHEHARTRKKKRSLSEKMKRQKSITTDDEAEKEQKRRTVVKSKSAKPVGKPRVSSSTGSAGEDENLVIPKLKLFNQPERASTPVKHQLEVKDPDQQKTPRSNVIATVQ